MPNDELTEEEAEISRQGGRDAIDLLKLDTSTEAFSELMQTVCEDPVRAGSVIAAFGAAIETVMEASTFFKIPLGELIMEMLTSIVEGEDGENEADWPLGEEKPG